MKNLFALILLILGAASAGALAWMCRYTVRDIGFVDLQGPIYTLEVVPQSGDMPSEVELKDLNQLTRTSNLRVVGSVDSTSGSIDPSSATDPLSEKSKAAAGYAQRSYVLKSAKREGSLLLGEVVPKSAGKILQSALRSPVRDILISEALQTFAFIVVVDSNDDQRNAEVQKLTASAQVHLQKLAPQLPRPIEQPVQVLHIPLAKRNTEKVLLWSLNLDSLPENEAALAVMYGRAKLLAAPLTKENLTERALLSQLALIGQSCECDTDRDWAAEPSLPHDWSEANRSASLSALGFQPDSPMVKSEVARILARGPEDGGILKDRRIGVENEDLFLGYGEYELNSGGGAPSSSTSANPSEVSNHKNLSLNSASAGEGDWGFSDDSGSAEDRDSKSVGASVALRLGPKQMPQGFRMIWLLPILLLVGSLFAAGWILYFGRRK